MTTAIHQPAGHLGLTKRLAALDADRILVVLQVLLAIGAIPGGVFLVLYPTLTGDALPFETIASHGSVSPFFSYLVPGLFLMVVIGFGAVLAAVLHARRSAIAPLVSVTVGLAMCIFEAVEMMVIEFHFLQPLYFVLGLAIISFALLCQRPQAGVRRAVRETASRLSWPAAGVTIAVFVALYALLIHPWVMTWDASAADQTATLTGDERKPDPAWIVTRAITVDAPADVVWAWLVQHGQDRAGFYSYDWLENLTGADIHNADSLHPEWQQRSIGEGIPMARAYTGSRYDFTLVTVDKSDPGKALITTGVTGDVGIRVLQAIDDHTTKLILRDREGTGSPNLFARAYRWLVWDPMHGVMQRGMLIGLKARAEGSLGEPALMYRLAEAGWLLAGIALAAVFALRRHLRPWVLVPIVLIIPALVLGHDPNAALAGFLAAGITTAGAVHWGKRWWPAFAILGAGVLLVLLLTMEAYVAFGLLFWGVLLWAALAWLVVNRPWTTREAL